MKTEKSKAGGSISESHVNVHQIGHYEIEYTYNFKKFTEIAAGYSKCTTMPKLTRNVVVADTLKPVISLGYGGKDFYHSKTKDMSTPPQKSLRGGHRQYENPVDSYPHGAFTGLGYRTIVKYDSHTELGVAPWLNNGEEGTFTASSCMTKCKSMAKCKYGTFVTEGERTGECWLSAGTSSFHTACGVGCSSFFAVEKSHIPCSLEHFPTEAAAAACQKLHRADVKAKSNQEHTALQTKAKADKYHTTTLRPENGKYKHPLFEGNTDISQAPTAYPTPAPTSYPTPSPTAYPTPSPTAYPTSAPTLYPTPYPTPYPTKYPTSSPTEHHCDAGTHYCWKDTIASANCVKLDGTQYQCECPTGYAILQQHVSHESDLKHKCKKTPAPTSYPTNAPA
jgi:hypothetical protein